MGSARSHRKRRLPREGRRRRRRLAGLDCSGAVTSTRRRKRAEQREFARQLRPGGLLASPLDEPTDCVHGCNGDCVSSGSGVCTFACHGGL